MGRNVICHCGFCLHLLLLPIGAGALGGEESSIILLSVGNRPRGKLQIRVLKLSLLLYCYWRFIYEYTIIVRSYYYCQSSKNKCYSFSNGIDLVYNATLRAVMLGLWNIDSYEA